MLLDCFRKTFTRLIGHRLENICRTHNLLKGLNFAAYKGSSTDVPLSVINGAIEHARTHNLPLYIACQDMRKAFNSVHLVSLRVALERIKVPTNICDLIINLFKNREIKVITSYGLTNVFTGLDGINQEDPFSFLMW